MDASKQSFPTDKTNYTGESLLHDFEDQTIDIPAVGTVHHPVEINSQESDDQTFAPVPGTEQNPFDLTASDDEDNMSTITMDTDSDMTVARCDRCEDEHENNVPFIDQMGTEWCICYECLPLFQ
jgi:hypothetical protein